MVTVRLFAAARVAVGAGTVEVEADSLADLLALLKAPMLDRCSYLVDGVAVTDRSYRLASGAVVDVLPPFAGG